MDGVLLLDKPSGLTSHDVVMRLRRTSGEKRIGHTGTLDPRATGLLLLVFGQSTRLASVLTGSDKTYEAAIQLGVTTDTDDADGTAIGNEAMKQRGNGAMPIASMPQCPIAPLPGEAAILAALDAFRGTFDQIPPQVSAKRVAGEKAYELARRDQPVELKPVTVTVRALDGIEITGDGLVRLRLVVSAGFYVRALARDLGAALGCGAHLANLRRSAVGAFTVDRALPLEAAEALGRGIEAHLIPGADALPDMVRVEVTELGLKRVTHGNPVGPEHLAGRWVPPHQAGGAKVGIVDATGRLVALADVRGGALHPVVVLS